MSTETYAANVLDVFARATDAERTDGMAWYDDARDLATELSPSDVWRGAGVIAAFSPVCPWDRNVFLARNAFSTGIASGHTKVMCSQAQRILDGEFTLDVLGGDKVRAFASAIADPNTDMVTIDRHAHDIAMGGIFTDETRKIGKRVYRTLSEAYRIAANDAGITVSQMQAVTWVTWRNEKGI